jgi:Phosphatidylserine/phosphatidylglycerophosphate/cardiolipin synthases and related enzymes
MAYHDRQDDRSMRITLVFFLFIAASTAQAAPNTVRDLQTCFTPGAKCAPMLISIIAKAKRSIFVQAYSFTSKPIATALIDAQKRGVSVTVVQDEKSAKGVGAQTQALKTGGVTVLLDGAHAISHNKVMVIDEGITVTGSYNFTASAESKNAENLNIIYDESTAQMFLANIKKHVEHSK